MNFLQEFKTFALRGNVIDLAVAVIIGGAFGKIVDSLVNHMIMPILGYLVGGVSFRHLYINLSDVDYATLADAQAAGAPLIRYGEFINTTVDFFIIALVIFVAIHLFTQLSQKAWREEKVVAPAEPVQPPEDILLLREIRDALRDPASRP